MAETRYTSWGRLPHPPPSRVVPLHWTDRLPDFAALAPVLAYGQGRSYGDVSLNAGGTLLPTAGLGRVLAFDAGAGVLRAEAGATLADVLARVVPHGWFLPVTPGTRFVSLGGAVANDVHGKNHHRAGTFGRFVTAMGLARSSGEMLALTPDGPHAELFRATVGGLGLTGLITWVELRLVPIRSDEIVQTAVRFASLEEFFPLSDAASARSPYVVAWVDALRPEGRGVLFEGAHARPRGPGRPLRTVPPPRLALPADAPPGLLRAGAVRAFNAAYYARAPRRPTRRRLHFAPFFYPLDALGAWNRAYGRRGFYQYQCVVPHRDSHEAVRALLGRVAAAGAGSFLAVLKVFGDVPSPGLMSFPRPGVTLALDVPNAGEETLRLLRSLDDLVAEAGGRVYPAKDAAMTPQAFQRFFPEWEEFARHADPAFASSFWRRVTA